MKRKQRLPLILFVACATLLGPVRYGRAQAPDATAPARHATRGRVQLTPAGRALHRSALLVDGHNDLPWQIRQKGSASFESLDIAHLQPDLHTDLVRLRQGGVGAQFWSVYVPASTAREGTALRETLEQIELVQAMIRRYPEDLELARTADDIERIHRAGKIASLIGVEGGHSIENSLQVLRKLYQLDARYLTLTHSATLPWADSATDEARHGGLTPFGEEVVREMNRLGMLVDLSHVSVDTMKDALRVSTAPVIFSHSSARALADHVRNVPDDVLRLTAAQGGIVMVNFYPPFVVPEAARRSMKRIRIKRQFRQQYTDETEFQNALARWDTAHPIVRGSIHDVVDHIAYIARVAGIDHVGIGADFDGVDVLPEQLEDVSCYPYITQELLNRGYADNDIRKILGGNLLRVLRRAEQVARELRRGRGS